MRVLVFSDSHGRIGDMQDVLERLRPHVNAVIHLGDNIRDAELLRQFSTADKSTNDSLRYFCVHGNCDGYGEPYKLININGRKIFITHGHQYGVKSGIIKLKQAAVNIKADACFYGHSHIAFTEYHKGMLVLNPGSISEPRGLFGASYAVVEVPKEGLVVANVVEINR